MPDRRVFSCIGIKSLSTSLTFDLTRALSFTRLPYSITSSFVDFLLYVTQHQHSTRMTIISPPVTSRQSPLIASCLVLSHLVSRAIIKMTERWKEGTGRANGGLLALYQHQILASGLRLLSDHLVPAYAQLPVQIFVRLRPPRALLIMISRIAA